MKDLKELARNYFKANLNVGNSIFIFRGKSKDTGDWIIGNNIVADNNKSLINGVEVDPHTIGQYSGRKDKYNTPVFLGDKIKYEDDDKISECTAIINYVSVYPETFIEVVGNIYENEE